MFEWLGNSFAILSVIPVVPFLLIWLGGMLLHRDRKKVLRLAMDVTFVFLLFSVAALFNMVFQNQFGFYLILIMLLIAGGLIGGAQTRLKGKLDGKRLMRALWRLGFVVMGISYFLFMLVGLLKYISQAM